MKIVVLGITGFIGKNLVPYLNDKDQYLCLVRKKSSLLTGKNIVQEESDFSEESLCNSFLGADVVLHMIGQMGGKGVTEKQFIDTNISLTQRVITACKKNNVMQLVYLSTPGVQGFGARNRSEDDPYAPRGEYERTKVEAEKIVKTLTESKTAWTIIRPDFVYGPEDTRRIKLYKNIRDGKFAITTSGKSYIHPTFVRDVVMGIMICLGNKKAYNEIFNISARTDITVNEYVTTIAQYFGKKPIRINIGLHNSHLIIGILEFLCGCVHVNPPITKSQIDFLGVNHSTSIQKAIDKLGYNPEYDFQTGFRETMEWIKMKGLM